MTTTDAIDDAIDEPGPQVSADSDCGDHQQAQDPEQAYIAHAVLPQHAHALQLHGRAASAPVLYGP